MRGLMSVVCAVAALAVSSAGNVATAQQGAIRITAPANGATISGPVTVQVAISGVPVKPAAEGDPDAFHYHIFVDVDPATVTQPGSPIPTGQGNIIHTADLNHSLGPLPPGQHTVVVILTKTNHIPLTPAVQDRVTFTVAGTGQGASAQPVPNGIPRTGTGPAGNSGALPLALALAPLAAGAGVMLLRRRVTRRR